MIDNVMLYNVGHFANFMSIFDPYAINSMSFYKGGFPAQYGGRVSSVLDIYLKEGDMNRFKGEANLGLFSGKLAFEGPIGKKASFLISYRRSTVDLFMASLHLLTQPDSKFFYNFHDLNVKANYQLNDKNHLYLSFYDGIDRLKTDSENSFTIGENKLRQYKRHFLNKWGSRSLSMRWNHIINNRTFNNFTLAYSGFRYLLESEEEILDNNEIYNKNRYLYKPQIDDLILKNDMEVLLGEKNKLNAGVHFVSHLFQPVLWEQERIHFYGTATFSSQNLVKLPASELFAYAQGKFLYNNDKITFTPGIRIGRYFLPQNRGFNLIEPRLGLSYRISPESSISLDYDKMGQTVHSLNSSGTSLTAVIWVPATENLRPTISHQLSLGWKKSFPDKDLEVVAGAFYKEMTHLIEYDGNTGFATIEGEWDEAIASGGFGRAFGLEVMANKNFKNFILEGNYTYSRSVRQFSEINKGRFYSQNFDRPHNLSLSSIYRFNKKLTLSAMFSYYTGQSITLGMSFYPGYNNHNFHGDLKLIETSSIITNINNQLASPHITNFEDLMVVDDINNYRMPDYHRMDVSLNRKKMWKNGWERTISVSVYNVYNRQNAYFIYTNKTATGLEFKKLTMFPILPTVSYQVSF